MAKRFTDTGKWNKPFLRGMKAPYKLLWLFILDECDHSGIWQVDFDVAQVKIGERLNKETAIKFFGDRILILDQGNKWFVWDFIDFQYGELNPLNRAHNSVIKTLNKFSIDYINKPLTSSFQGGKDMDMEQDKDMYKGGVGENYYRVIKHLKITHEELIDLVNEGWTKEQIDDILDQIENFKKNTNYTNLKTTARNWLKRHYPEQKPSSIEKKISANEQVKRMYQ